MKKEVEDGCRRRGRLLMRRRMKLRKEQGDQESKKILFLKRFDQGCEDQLKGKQLGCRPCHPSTSSEAVEGCGRKGPAMTL